MKSHDDDDTLRILVATDNHLGVWEDDLERREDSFNTFEEILKIGKENKVDCVLLGGDLFHENKPSRYTLIRTIDILKKYCLGDEEVKFQVVSDQSVNFTTGRVNYEDPNSNVGLPIFTIHGNHDDPSAQDNMSAVDILATINLVNYFGKVAITGSTGTGSIQLSPVLMKKGETRLALYGLGNIRDERLCRLFSAPKAVAWERPMDDGTWINVFTLHQNRVAHVRDSKSHLKESQLPSFLDVVIWGHEHECIESPWKSVGTGSGRFSIFQPGSSVATALSEGESKKKHVFMLEFNRNRWRHHLIPLETVRPFLFSQVALAKQPSVSAGNPDSVTRFIVDKIEKMIGEAVRSKGAHAPQLPLIRCRVDYTGFSTINTQRMAQTFLKKVANPQDILIWHKAQGKSTQKEIGVQSFPRLGEEIKIEDLIADHLLETLKILPETELADALHDFIDKEERSALSDTVSKVMNETRDYVEKHTTGKADEDELQAISAAVESAVEWRRRLMRSKDAAKMAKKILDQETQETSNTLNENVDPCVPMNEDCDMNDSFENMEMIPEAENLVRDYPTRSKIPKRQKMTVENTNMGPDRVDGTREENNAIDIRDTDPKSGSKEVPTRSLKARRTMLRSKGQGKESKWGELK